MSNDSYGIITFNYMIQEIKIPLLFLIIQYRSKYENEWN